MDWGPEYPSPPVEGGEEGPEESDYEGVHPWEWLLARDDVRVCVERFSHDEQDVYRRLLRLQPYYPDIEFSKIAQSSAFLASGPAWSRLEAKAIIPHLEILP